MLIQKLRPRQRALLPQSAVVLLTLAACQKAPTPVAPIQTQASPVKAPMTPAPAPAASISVAPPPSAVAPGEKETTLEEMSYAVQAWFTSRGAAPKSLQELVKAGFIKKLPTPPPGQEFALDTQNLRVVLVNR